MQYVFLWASGAPKSGAPKSGPPRAALTLGYTTAREVHFPSHSWAFRGISGTFTIYVHHRSLNIVPTSAMTCYMSETVTFEAM